MEKNNNKRSYLRENWRLIVFTALAGALFSFPLGLYTQSYFFEQEVEKEVSLKFTAETYLPLLSALADFNRSDKGTKKRDDRIGRKVYSMEEMKEHDRHRVQKALENFFDSGAGKMFRHLELKKGFIERDEAYMLIEHSYRLGVMYELTKESQYRDLQRKTIHKLFEALYTKHEDEKVKPDPSSLRITPSEFGELVWDYLKLRSQAERVKFAVSEEENEHLKFDKIPIEGLIGASGFVIGRNNISWATSDKDNKLFKIEERKGKKYAQEIKLQFSKKIKAKIIKEMPEFKFDRLDMEGITFDSKRKVFYIISESNRAVIKVSEKEKDKVTGYFFVEGENVEKNIGLEGITFDEEQDIVYIIDEGPHNNSKKLYRYDVKGREVDDPIEINVYERITGLTYIGNNEFYALNTFRSREGELHSVIRFLIEGDMVKGKVKRVVSINKYYANFRTDFNNHQTNYEGIDMDEKGNIYIINDASKAADLTNLLVISKP